MNIEKIKQNKIGLFFILIYTILFIFTYYIDNFLFGFVNLIFLNFIAFFLLMFFDYIANLTNIHLNMVSQINEIINHIYIVYALHQIHYNTI